VSARLRASLDPLLRGAIEAGDVPGVVAAVANRAGTVYEAAHGERALGEGPAMTLDTVCWIASMTKPVTGAAAMQLVEQGKLDLDAPAARILPELGRVQVLEGWDDKGEPRLRPAKGTITLRRLLTHTSGFVYDIWNGEMARYLRHKSLPRVGSGKLVALGVPLAFDPGERWEYGIGIDWAGRMVEAASGLRFADYLSRNIFSPLGMDSTAYILTPAMRARLAKVHNRGADGRLAPSAFETEQNLEFEPGGGGLYSCIGDYLRFVRMIMNGGEGNGHRLLRRETVELMSRNAMGATRVAPLKSTNAALSLDAEFFPGLPKSWGLTFMINEEAAPTGRSAGGLAWAGLGNTYFWIDPKKDIAGVLLTQILPFVDTRALALFLDFEKAVYQTVL
jgi:methyl acetate hydrolase